MVDLGPHDPESWSPELTTCGEPVESLYDEGPSNEPGAVAGGVNPKFGLQVEISNRLIVSGTGVEQSPISSVSAPRWNGTLAQISFISCITTWRLRSIELCRCWRLVSSVSIESRVLRVSIISSWRMMRAER